jgi:hypothetical protein
MALAKVQVVIAEAVTLAVHKLPMKVVVVVAIVLQVILPMAAVTLVTAVLAPQLHTSLCHVEPVVAAEIFSQTAEQQAILTTKA